MCPQCGGKLFIIAEDHFNGTLYECETCGAKSDHTEIIEEGPESESLRGAHEAAIGERQYQQWLTEVNLW